MAKKTIKIRQKKSTIGCTSKQIACIKGLGLRKINHEVTLNDSPEIRGMMKVVNHMIEVSQ